MSEVTRILSAMKHQDSRAAEQLLPLVYDELRRLAAQKLAQEKPGQTLQPTALVHEAYIRLVKGEGSEVGGELRWDSQGHFFAAAAEAMRRILIDRARSKRSTKRGAGCKRLGFGLATCSSWLYHSQPGMFHHERRRRSVAGLGARPAQTWLDGLGENDVRCLPLRGLS
jgi:RNA polymerase sigma factor (TIGR02999 family)